MDGALLVGSSFPAGGFRGFNTRRRIVVSAAEDGSGGGGSAAGTSTSREEQRRRKGKMGVQRSKDLSVMEVQRLIGVSDEEEDGGWVEDGSRRSSVLDFWASTPIGQAESAPEKKLREIGEWLIERTESQQLLGQQILITVCLYILPAWVLLVLLASGAITLPFDVPFLNDLLS